ncbi:hypothetical protein CEE45_14565 [Candidatus Heimdallarchaeota archaeon B3_Heim]|nr:MAG: hypothetical protein CEE45_14565 [Candidatus Heimdallarchaeota archaeon B3_Heim]
MANKQQDESIIEWLLKGDPSIRWQTMKDLGKSPKREIFKERSKIEQEGWGKMLMDFQDPAGTWGNNYYTPKWTSTTYTLLLLRRLGINPLNERCKLGCNLLLTNGLLNDGGINYSKTKKKRSETCITGLVFGILSYFKLKDERMEMILAYLIKNQMEDGGWNCRFPRGATHASFHTTLMVLEALYEYQESFSNKNSKEILRMRQRAQEFLLLHELYKSHRTGETVSTKMTMLSFPPRWHYTVIAALDYFQKINHEKDERFSDAIKILTKKEKKGKWPLQSPIKGKIWFDMEPVRFPSRWNTLRALRILQWWNQERQRI